MTGPFDGVSIQGDARGEDARMSIEDVLWMNCKRKARDSAFIDYDGGGKSVNY
jgi:hypothetical protein